MGRFLFGTEPTRRLAVVHYCQSTGDGLFVVSLAGSLFFNASLDAARPNILFYLLLTMAPFAVLAPLVGPFIDRASVGYARVIGLANAQRAVVCLLLALHLRTVLFYPEALAVLVGAKTYSVAKAALVPRLETRQGLLLAANARLSRLGALGGATGGLLGAGIIALTSGEISVIVAAAVFSTAAALSLRLHRTGPPPSSILPGEELEELLNPDILAASLGMTVLRAATGFLAFFVAFELKRAGAAPWLFGLVAATSTLGAISGTVLGPGLRRRLDERSLLRVGLAVPALVCLAGVVRPDPVVFVACVLALGLGANIGRLAFDSIVQSHAPDVDRGRTFARFETRFQLAWVAGALGPVGLRLPAWLGLLLTAGLLAGGIATVRFERAAQLRIREAADTGVDLGMSIVEHARRLHAAGHHRHAVLEAALLIDLVNPENHAATAAPHQQLQTLRRDALRGSTGPDKALEAIGAATAIASATKAPPSNPSPSG